MDSSPLRSVMNLLFHRKQEFEKRISTIPKKNKLKFQADLLKLIELAHMENYENYNI